METTPDLFANLSLLPPAERYPTNIGRKSLEFLKESFAGSSEFTIITGYSSLDFLIAFFSRFDLSKKGKIEVILGNEPMYRELVRKRTFHSLSQEITDYWLAQNVSANYCWPVLQLIEHIKQDKVIFKTLEGLHAKIYIGDTEAMMGSSNFSKSGLEKQKEANVRVEKTAQPEVYEAFRSIARYYSEQAQNARQVMLDLLKQLLQLVGWKEALARAVGEVLEGDAIHFNSRISELFRNLNPSLWRVQEEAIGQALYVLDNFGSVLIADPTGSGKTRVGAALQLCLKNRVALTGGMPNDDNTLLISPPQVMDNWQQEFVDMGSAFLNIVSQGALSFQKAGAKNRLSTRVQNARTIILDEAHNYLSAKSNRSESLQFNLADHLVLLTATPINRRVEDIFRLIEIMGIDNLDDSEIEKYQTLYKQAQKGKSLSDKEKEVLGSYLSQFLVRRTKRELNQRVDAHPEGHRLSSGRVCRFPRQVPDTYPLNEVPEDIEIARQINELASQLKGLIRLRSIRLRADERGTPEQEQRAIEWRLTAARALSLYNIQALLRSSGVALIEHIEGTSFARRYLFEKGFPLPGFKSDKETGDMIGKLAKHHNALPDIDSELPIPDWLTDEALYKRACEKEMEVYESIANLAKQLSFKREEAKADFLSRLMEKHELILGFDRNVITLHLMQKILARKYPGREVLVVTGSEKGNQIALKERFSLGSDAKGCIGLCSEVMSEGVNLQRASAVVMLDLPGVLRIAEQRIGRIDRMNSPHDAVEVYFPNDHKAFALRTDRKFYFTVKAVEELIGGNVDLPEEMMEKWKVETISGADIAKKYLEIHEAASKAFVDGIKDAFQPLRELISGEESLIDAKIYQEIRHSKAMLMSMVKTGASFVKSDRNWGFFCLRSTSANSSVWLLVEEQPSSGLLFQRYDITRSLPEICSRLRIYLKNAVDIIDLPEIQTLQPFVDQLFRALKDHEIDSLPNKKKRALRLLGDLIEHYTVKKGLKWPALNELRKTLNPHDEEVAYDYYELARRWIRLIQPYIVEERKNKQRSGNIVHLGMMAKKFKKTALPETIFEELLKARVFVLPIEKRVAAYIVGTSI